jgi:hypothetical protein
MATSVCYIEPSFGGVMDQVPCTGTCRLNPKTAVRLRDIVQKILRMNTTNIQTNTYKEFIKDLNSKYYSNRPFVYFAHSVAMEKLFGKDRVVALASIAPAMIDSETWAPADIEEELVASLVREIGDGGDQEAIEYQLDIVKKMYKAGYISLPSQIVAKVLKSDQRTIDSLCLFVQELVTKRYIELASQVHQALMEAVSTFRESPSWVNLAESIKIAREKTMHERKQPPFGKGNTDIFYEVWKKIIDFYTAKGLAPIEIKLERQYGERGYSSLPYGASFECCHRQEVLPSLASVAKKLILSRMIDPLFEVVKAIHELNDNEADKCCCIADIAVGLLPEEHGEEYMARIICHDGQDKSVDVPLVCQIVRNLTQNRELKRALLLAEQYLQGSFLSTAFDVFAQVDHQMIKKDLLHLDSVLQIELKQRGQLFVSLVKELATIDLQRARDLIKRASDYSVSEEDQIEAGIYLAKAAIVKKEGLEDVLAELAHTVSPGGIDSERIKKANIRLVEVLLTNSELWDEADKVIICLRGVVESEVLDSLLARVVIAETKVAIEEAKILGRDRTWTQ